MKLKKIITKDILSKLVEMQLRVEKLPPLSSVDQAKLEQSMAIDQLYYSSKVEGTHLTNEMIDKAIHGKEISAA